MKFKVAVLVLAVGAMGMAGVGACAAERNLADGLAAAGAATVTPVMTEGPYWVDEMLRRSDVRGNTSSATTSAGAVQAGVPWCASAGPAQRRGRTRLVARR